MASLIEELVSTLDREDRLYTDLIPIQEKKLRAIVTNDLETIGKLAEEEQTLVDEVGMLEAKRMRITDDIATVLGKPQGTMKLEQIVQTLKNQPDEQKKLQELHDRLRRTIARLQELNVQNKDLLDQVLEMVEFNMNVIRSTRMSSGSSNYSSSAAQVDLPDMEAGMFDAKQ
ncbi:MAG: flagellar protein FlgN [Eubacterium sp.]|nr:flagellar protein FlgN [Eubacterium sp.]